MPHPSLKIAGASAAILALSGAFALRSVLEDRKEKQRQGDDAPGRTARRRFGDYAVAGRTVTIARPQHELYAFWRDFENLAGFMENIESIRRTGAEGRTLWTIRAPAGNTVEIETEIVKEEDGHLIAWRSIPGSDVETEGRVTFEKAPGERGTRVSATIAYKPIGGAMGRALAKLFLREPEIQTRHDLKRFKMMMEAGEIATSVRRRDQTRAARQAKKSREKEEA
ncbi:SRPBCC family protein [Rhizorhapis sp. SPR117]|uniref:SRPBCC family protein n=1 Tax=Rhizorhapis sp. SPR117 TaxID=2912611 RepID=UPI001F178CD5|nr:SRPBCC family protein [Rhizorhapis sp. SPR117]